MLRLDDLDDLQAHIMERIAKAAEERDVNAVRHWSAVAEEWEALHQTANDLAARVQRLQESIADRGAVPMSGYDTAPETKESQRTLPAATPVSARAEGAAARMLWVQRVGQAGVSLVGSGKRYHTRSGLSLGLAFANELPGFPNKWWLGLADEQTDFAVLLCRQRSGSTLDIVIPVDAMERAWRSLSRSNGQIKFNVRRDASDLLLLVPNSQPISVKRYVGNVGALLDDK